MPLGCNSSVLLPTGSVGDKNPLDFLSLKKIEAPRKESAAESARTGNFNGRVTNATDASKVGHDSGSIYSNANSKRETRDSGMVKKRGSYNLMASVEADADDNKLVKNESKSEVNSRKSSDVLKRAGSPKGSPTMPNSKM